MAQTIGRVLYDNVMRQAGAVITYSGTETTNFEVANSYDWRDFSQFRPSDGLTTVDITVAAEVTIDHAFMYLDTNSTGATLKLQVETGVGTGVYTDLATFDPVNNKVEMHDFTPTVVAVGVNIRWEIEDGADGFDISQLVVSEALLFSIGQHVGVRPNGLTGGNIQVNNVISVNGSVIGRSIKRIDKSNQIDLEYLDRSWLDTEWGPFAQHAIKNAFVYSWDHVNHPQDVSFSVAEQIRAPENMSPVPKMKVSMPLRSLVD